MTDETLGQIGDEIIFENEFVRVWGLRLEPGERQSWHVHQLPYLVIPLTDGRNEMHWKDGRVVNTAEVPGQALWRMPGAAHELVNTSDWTYRNILVEVKTAGGAA
ncbi:cupin [Phreatobacter stygius]|uniref:Cupin n=1 Tax=Phreatobacter stygius TaxID=1940610 RepID=A0A4D7BC11_9HYPH|nr:cupin [Phreatobacter stygius]QCI67598.1 cupin [Phreatobacter stygius]